MAAGPIPPSAGEERDCDKGRWGYRVNEIGNRKLSLQDLYPRAATHRSIDEKDDGSGLTAVVNGAEKNISAGPYPRRSGSFHLGKGRWGYRVNCRPRWI